MASSRTYDLEMARRGRDNLVFDMREIGKKQQMKADEIEAYDILTYGKSIKMIVHKSRRNGKMITIQGVDRIGLQIKCTLLRDQVVGITRFKIK